MPPEPQARIHGAQLTAAAPRNDQGSVPLNRDQQRAAWAYNAVYSITPNDSESKLFGNYRTLVNGLGANLIRSGLVATIAFVQRYHDDSARDALLAHLADKRGLAHVLAEPPSRDTLAATIRNLELPEYMLATRELMRLAQWLKRACQARKAEAE